MICQSKIGTGFVKTIMYWFVKARSLFMFCPSKVGRPVCQSKIGEGFVKARLPEATVCQSKIGLGFVNARLPE